MKRINTNTTTQKALIIIDLPGKTNSTQKDIFNKILEKANWQKLYYPRSSWEVLFNKKYELKNVKKELMDNILKAKEKSKVAEVYFLIQLDYKKIIDDII